MDTLTQIAIWNRALGFLGARSIAAEDENTPEALQCRLYWDSARRQALRDYCSARDSIAVPASRSTAIGTASYPIKDRLPVMAVVIVGVLIALVASIPKWKEEKHFSFRGK